VFGVDLKFQCDQVSTNQTTKRKCIGVLVRFVRLIGRASTYQKQLPRLDDGLLQQTKGQREIDLFIIQHNSYLINR